MTDPTALPDSNTRVAVVGAGSMGAGIAQLAAQSGHAVQLHDAQAGAAAAALVRIAADLDGAVARGKLERAERDAVLARIGVAETLESLAGCGLVIEAIVEKLEVKQAVFRALERVQGVQGLRAVFATNTSSISITAVAQGLAHPQRVVGWHFFNPATRMKLVEVIAGVETEPAVLQAMRALSKAWGKTPVDAPNAPGFIVNRVARPYYAEALRLLAERLAPVPAIDRLMREAGGFALGPFELMDLIGLDVNLSVTESVFHATGFDTRYAPHLIQQELVRSGRFGRKTGRGFYAYGAGVAKPVVEVVAPAVAPLDASIETSLETSLETSITTSFETSPPSSLSTPRQTREPLQVPTDPGLLAPLVQRLRSAGVEVRTQAGLPFETLAIGAVRIALTDGRTAVARNAGADSAGNALILLDLARDFSTTTTLGATAQAGANPAAVRPLPWLAAMLAAADIALIELADVAGLALMRTVCCLANEAADVMTWTTTTAADIDTAMRLGTAYPVGPLAWADALGPARVAGVLANLQAHYGDPRYRRAPALSMRSARPPGVARLHG